MSNGTNMFTEKSLPSKRSVGGNGKDIHGSLSKWNVDERGEKS
jgi:hypothetical protein